MLTVLHCVTQVNKCRHHFIKSCALTKKKEFCFVSPLVSPSPPFLHKTRLYPGRQFSSNETGCGFLTRPGPST